MSAYKLKIMRKNVSIKANRIGLIIFILIGAILILFTFKTPHLGILEILGKVWDRLNMIN